MTKLTIHFYNEDITEIGNALCNKIIIYLTMSCNNNNFSFIYIIINYMHDIFGYYDKKVTPPEAWFSTDQELH